jgi:hypothetical protein
VNGEVSGEEVADCRRHGVRQVVGGTQVSGQGNLRQVTVREGAGGFFGESCGMT